MIKIDVDKFKAEVSKLECAKKEFQSYSDSFIRDTISNLDECKSDFIDEIQGTLFNMTDTKATDLMEKLNVFHQKLKTVVEDFEIIDKELAEHFNIEISYGAGDNNV